MNRFRQILKSAIVLCAVAMTFSACSMMEDDRKDCPTGLYVRFVYDYNTMRADMFKDHVGSVTLFVYDENDRLVTERTVSNSELAAPLSEYGYTMHFTEDEVPAGHSYRLQAVAMQKDWDQALATQGAKYRRTNPTNPNGLIINLDRESTPIPHHDMYQVSNDAPLDTLWHTLKVRSYEPQSGKIVPPIHQTNKPYSVYPVEDQRVAVVADKATYATVCLIRDTKHLNISVRQGDKPSEVFDEMFEIEILDTNGILAGDNSLMPCDSLRYSPYMQWTTEFTPSGGLTVGVTSNHDPDLQRSAHYDIMFNRLVVNTKDTQQNARLNLYRLNEKGERDHVVAEINLPYILAEARTGWEIYNYGMQEYLDREHNYRLDFILYGNELQYIYVVIDVLSWQKRIMYVDL